MTIRNRILRHWLFALVYSCSAFAQTAVVYTVPENTAAEGAHLRDEMIRAEEAFRKWKQQTELRVLNHGAVDFSYDFRFAVPHKEPAPVAVGPCSSEQGNNPLNVSKTGSDPYAWDTPETDPGAETITSGTLQPTQSPDTETDTVFYYTDGSIGYPLPGGAVEKHYSDGRIVVTSEQP